MTKKLFALLSALALVFSLAACGPGDGGASNDSDTSTTVEEGGAEEAANELEGEAQAEELEQEAEGEATSSETGGSTGGDEETGG